MVNKAHTQDALTLLLQDHNEVRSAFKQYEELGDRAYEAKKDLAEKICCALTMHMAIKEEVFYPTVRDAIQDGEALVSKLVARCATAKELITQIRDMEADAGLFDVTVHALAQRIDHYIQEEENEIFPRVRESDLNLEFFALEILERKAQWIDAMPMQPRLSAELSLSQAL
jgi:hypothetical protein